jgi:hypothetical protein
MNLTNRICLLFTISLFLQGLQAQVYDIKVFLEQCPTNDPAIETILSDFEIRVNFELVTDFPCTEPVSAMDISDYSDALIALQGFRVMYYIDRNRTNHLTWTDKTLYDWMKDNIDGINIRDDVSGGYCCVDIEGKKFFVSATADEYNREFDKTWRGIAGNIDFYAHEVRHTNGHGYLHTSCCGITYGCDSIYDENDPGAYGIQYWLNKCWPDGTINVGAGISSTSDEISEIISWHLSSANIIAENRYCTNPPPVINIDNIENPPHKQSEKIPGSCKFNQDKVHQRIRYGCGSNLIQTPPLY